MGQRCRRSTEARTKRRCGPAKRRLFKRRRHKAIKRALKTKVFYYYAVGDGESSQFTLADATPGYDNRLPDSRKMSFINVFVDGMLQPPNVYRLEPGKLSFSSPPVNNAVIIAQFISIFKDRCISRKNATA
ncbi:DUF4183 domain-containing protein [Paenibacillus sp. CAU 1782]